MESDRKSFPDYLIFENPLVLDTIFKTLPLSSLCSCRLVSRFWNNVATVAIRKSLKTRLLLCADSKCTANLKKFIGVFQGNSIIPYARAILIMDHLPPKVVQGMQYTDGEMEMLMQLSELFSDHKSRPSEHCSHHSHVENHEHGSLFKDVPPRGKNGNTVKAACDLFSDKIENLIINLTLHQDNSTNMEYWLEKISFSNLTELNFHITRASPEDISTKSIQIFFNSLVNLKALSVRKLAKKGDQLLTGILLALTKKSHLTRLKNLSIEAFTDDKWHLELLTQCQLFIERLSLIYLGGEVRFIEKTDLIKRLLQNLSGTLQHLYTHLPLFTLDQTNFPKLPFIKTLKIEKVYREFSVNQVQLFGFDFNHYFPNIERIFFKDYDLWKNLELKTFPLKEVIPCPEIKDISLPDLCFDAPLMERYFMKFPNLRKLSIIVSYVSRYQKQCSFCLVYAFLPQLKDLHISLLEIDVATCDHIFTGITEDNCREIISENRRPEESERGLSIIMLSELETLKITSVHDKRVLGITDISVKFAFMEMPALRRLFLGSCMISAGAMSLMAKKFDVTVLSHFSNHSSLDNAALTRDIATATVPDIRDNCNRNDHQAFLADLVTK